MKTFKSVKLLIYLYVTILIIFVLVLFHNLKYGFDKEMIIGAIISVSVLALIITRFKIVLYDDYMELISPYWIKNKIVRYRDIKCLKVEGFQHLLAKGYIPTIAIYENRDTNRKYIFYKVLMKEDIIEIINTIKSKNKKVIVSEYILKLLY